MNADIFRTCINRLTEINQPATFYGIFGWKSAYHLTVKVKILDTLEAMARMNNIRELATVRGLTIACVSTLTCEQLARSKLRNAFHPSVPYGKKGCLLTEEFQLSIFRNAPAEESLNDIDELVMQEEDF